MLDINKIRSEYPILDRKIFDRQLVYLDTAATSQTPQCVVDKICDMYHTKKANVHRGVHQLSQEATDCMESTREKVRSFLNADSTEEIIFTRGTTEAINLVASSYGEKLCNGDEIILTAMEHHSNIVPWQLLQQRKRIRINVVPINEKGELRQDIYEDMFTENTRLVAFCHVSNVLGTVNPVKQMIEIARRHGVPVLVDGAQAAPHIKVDVKDLDADFYVMSAHKMYGPTGVGVLYAKKELLERMSPYQGGGEMIGNVSFEKTTFAALPYKFEAGTPDFVGIAAFGEAIDYINRIGLDNIAAHEHQLLDYATRRLMEIPDMRIFGTADRKSGVISFLVGNIHHYDMGMLLDKQGVAVRTGHHCAEPLMHTLGIEGTVRASFGVYNTREEIDAFVEAVKRAAALLA
ncbi:MAG: cysteine desulfurase [Bacteroidales bacterium]|nr:cysteine desulfurase [Bacteroidales bacterium]MDD6141468.1 cysteine desulfurase [Bacteroidales bacterium]MDD6622606.1 cysteine desulfurase [Bacteroidales bacterium]MDD6668714.1 cysteine desulfurase [Bacteroidales bacterium]